MNNLIVIKNNIINLNEVRCIYGGEYGPQNEKHYDITIEYRDGMCRFSIALDSQEEMLSIFKSVENRINKEENEQE